MDTNDKLEAAWAPDDGAFAVCLSLIWLTVFAGFEWSAYDGAPNPLMTAWLACGVVVALLFGVCAFRPRILQDVLGPRAAGISCLAVAALAIVMSFRAHTRYGLVIGIAMAFFSLLLAKERANMRAYAVAAGCVAAWALTLGFPYTHVADWLLGATTSSTLAFPAFVIAFVACCYAAVFARGEGRVPKLVFIGQFVIAAVCFAFFGFRTDNELATWIPYHQYYLVAAAALVQQHHWLLWDVPSQYGFFSILAVAIAPGHRSFDGLFLLTGIVLLSQALMTYLMIRSSIQGWLGFVFAIAVCLAAFYSSQTSYYPFGPRLYPQEGLRFIWPIAMVFFAFYHYRAQRSAYYQRWLLFGLYLCWLAAILWSFETGIWVTVALMSFAAGEALATMLETGSLVRAGLRLLMTIAPAAILALSAVAAVEQFYRANLGHGPDWISYYEFGALYAGGSATQAFLDPRGAGWIIVLLLGVLAALIMASIARRHYRAIPLLTCSFGAFWAASSYYVSEPFNQHGNMLAGLMTALGAVVFAVGNDLGPRTVTTLVSRLSLVPLFVLLTAYSVASPQRLHNMKFIESWGNVYNYSDSLPPIGGELSAFERQIGVADTDAVIYPSSTVWVKTSSGLIIPLERSTTGSLFERKTWLPLSPAEEFNTWLSLPFSRRIAYVERFLDDTPNPSGWYMTYREDADCTQLSPRLETVKRFADRNYRAAYCVLRPQSRWLSSVPVPDYLNISLPVTTPTGSLPVAPPSPVGKGHLERKFQIPFTDVHPETRRLPWRPTNRK